MYRTLGIAFLILALSIVSKAQEKIKGTITDSSTGNAVSFATIGVQDSKITLTNENGEFEIVIQSLPVILRVSHLNFETKMVKVESASRKLNVQLNTRVLMLKEVSVGNPAIAIMQDASDKSVKSYKVSCYGKAFLRQIAYDNGQPVYLNEIVMDAEWRPTGMVAWHPTEARHLENTQGISYTNFSFYTFALSGYIGNSVHKKPLPGKVDSLYTFKLAGTYDQDGQEIAKITCTPKPKLIKGQHFEGIYYVNTVTNNVIKIDGLIKGVEFTGGGPATVKNIETVFIAQYSVSKSGENVLDYTVLNSTNKMKIMGFGVKNTDLYSTLYMQEQDNIDQSQLKELTPRIDDTNLVRAITYNADFWNSNQGIKRTEKEQSAIRFLEKHQQ